MSRRRSKRVVYRGKTSFTKETAQKLFRECDDARHDEDESFVVTKPYRTTFPKPGSYMVEVTKLHRRSRDGTYPRPEHDYIYVAPGGIIIDTLPEGRKPLILTRKCLERMHRRVR